MFDFDINEFLNKDDLDFVFFLILVFFFGFES